MNNKNFSKFIRDLHAGDNVHFTTWNKCTIKYYCNGDIQTLQSPFTSKEEYESFAKSFLLANGSKLPFSAKLDTENNCKIVVSDSFLSLNNNYVIFIRKLS